MRILLHIESSRASGRDLLKGIAGYSRLHGDVTFHWEPRGLQPTPLHLTSWKPDGIITRDPDIREMMGYGVPLIVVGHRYTPVPGIVNIITDSASIGRMAAEHLLASGLKCFAFCGFQDKPWSGERRASFCGTVAKAGYDTSCYESPEPAESALLETGLNDLAQWLLALPKPVGVMACNDDRAQQVSEACQMAGIQVPEQVALVGADNDELICEFSAPPLSSVAINFERAGYEAAETMRKLVAGERPDREVIFVPPTHLVTRQSTDILAVGDEAVASGVRFIRARYRDGIGVEDVARAAGVSRRILEKRFRTVLGRSVLKEIRRVRVDHIARLLTERDMPILQIALTSGFDGVGHFARYFREEKGMSPLAYRRQYTAR